MKVAVIGCGYWGSKLLQRFSSILGPDGVCAADRDVSRLSDAADACGVSDRRLVEARGLSDVLDGVDACVIATPISTHYALAVECLESGRHVLCEKPMAMSAEHARALISLAAQRRLTLCTDLTFLYHASTVSFLASGNALTSLVWSGRPSTHSNEDVFWTWGPHPISILVSWLLLRGLDPLNITAHGRRSPDDCTVVFRASGMMSIRLHVAWGATLSRRRALFSGETMIDLGLAPEREPLLAVCEAFLDGIAGEPETDQVGLLTVEVMSWLTGQLV